MAYLIAYGAPQFRETLDPDNLKDAARLLRQLRASDMQDIELSHDGFALNCDDVLKAYPDDGKTASDA